MTTLGIPEAVLRKASHAADELQNMAGVAVDARLILTGRAALLGIAPSGRISAGGATQLIRAVDGWCALTLSRHDDVAAVPALAETDETPLHPWQTVCQWARTRTVESVVQRARLLDIPVAALGETTAAAPPVLSLGAVGKPRDASALLVVDMTSMWAGPLCGQILCRAGATVIKVESPSRPDGTRSGNRAFFDWMNGGKLSYAADFDRDVRKLRALLSVADVVLEGSRPAALARRGLGPHDVAPRPGRVWLRISGYGTRGDNHQRPAFGDDAAVAGGLVRWAAGEPAFLGDAIADPLTGIACAQAVLESTFRGGGDLIEIAMAEVAAAYAELPTLQEKADIAPTSPGLHTAARALGADNDTVARLVSERLGTPC